MKKDIKEIFSSNLKYYMKMHNENLTKLSDSIGVAYSTISDWQHGKKMPRSGSLEILSEHYDINISDLTSERKTLSNVSDYRTEYNFFDTGISAGTLQTIDPFTSNEVQTINMPNALLGKYAGDKDIFISRINGESMNRCIPDESIIAIKKFSSLYELKDGDIVVFQDASEMSIKRFYNDQKNKIISFIPDSSNKDFHPILYRYEDIQQINILGKVVMYTVEL